jgi:hypothetical protein
VKQEHKLSEVSEVPGIVHDYGRMSVATLAIDAISLDNVFLTNRAIAEGQPSHAFVFECLPLTVEQKCFPFHVMRAISGNAKRLDIEIADHIVKDLRQSDPPAEILFIATDRDAGYSDRHKI